MLRRSLIYWGLVLTTGPLALAADQATRNKRRPK